MQQKLRLQKIGDVVMIRKWIRKWLGITSLMCFTLDLADDLDKLKKEQDAQNDSSSI
jgi:hypothetical protein